MNSRELLKYEFVEPLDKSHMNVIIMLEKSDVNKIASELETYSPFDMSELDGRYVVRLVLVKGIFPWHSHQADEFFLTLESSLSIETDKARWWP